jgi:prolyl-tRNA synthetase
MGTYGLGSSRVLGESVEAYHAPAGIVWPEAVAPFAVHLVSLCREGDSIKKADAFYEELTRRGIAVLYDDRPSVRAGEKFSDADLIGIPTRMVISEKTLANSSIEVKKRVEKTSSLVPLAKISMNI